MKRNILIGLVVVGAFTSGFAIGNKGIQEATKKAELIGYELAQNELVGEHIEVEETDTIQVITVDTAHEDLKEIAQAKGLKEFNKYITTLSNGSTIISIPQLDKYYFMPYEMGDWDYTTNSKIELRQMVETYINMKASGTY